MKIEEAVKWMEEAIQKTTECFEECSPALQKELIEQKEVFELALTALRSMPEAGEPLTVKKLREVPHGKVKDGTLQNIANRANEIASPPAHIDRSKWEGCVDCRIKCRTCVVRGKEKCARCEKYSEYVPENNFCSNCGRPLTEEAWTELERRLMG